MESRLRHFSGAAAKSALPELAALALEMEELWLQTRKRSEAELRLVAEIQSLRSQLNRNLRAAELQLAHIRTRLQFPKLRVPSRWRWPCAT